MAGRWRNDWLPACCAAACRCNTVINTSLDDVRYIVSKGGQKDKLTPAAATMRE